MIQLAQNITNFFVFLSILTVDCIASADPLTAAASSTTQLSFIISAVTSLLQLFIILLWAHITLYYLGDILDVCQLVLEAVGSLFGVAAAKKDNQGVLGARRVCHSVQGFVLTS